MLIAIATIKGTDLFQEIWDLVVDAPIIQPLTVVLKNNLSSIDREGERGAGPSLSVGQNEVQQCRRDLCRVSKVSRYASLLYGLAETRHCYRDPTKLSFSLTRTDVVRRYEKDVLS